MKFLFIGDPHIKNDNSQEIDILIKEIERVFTLTRPDFIIIAGDVMHYHEKIYTPALNKSLDFIRAVSQLAFTYILVGNHDYENNSQFLSQNHWMNALKKWDRVKIVDDVVNETDYMLVPYVFPGRFVEALETKTDMLEWKRKKVIFAHQEFKGCKMGSILSTEGDSWGVDDPQVVSGHIHDNQKVGNVYYPGTPLHHTFGDNDEKVLCVVDISTNNVNITDYPLNVPKKQIMKASLRELTSKKELKDFVQRIEENMSAKIKVKIDGTTEEFRLFKETREYKELVEKGVKFQLQREKGHISENEEVKEVGHFKDILEKMVDEDEEMVRELYDELFGEEMVIQV
jgi:DNA repair exonuclease SbcCD nuclease subunit